MSRRRLRTVYTSSSSDDDENLPQQPPHSPNPNPNPNFEQFNQPQQPPPNNDQDVFFDDAMAVEEDDVIETPSPFSIPNFDSVTLNSSHTTPTTTTSTAAAAVSEQPSAGISDEDFLDVSDELFPPQSVASSDCPVNDYLRRLGLSLKREWLDSCKLGLHDSVTGFSNFDVETKAKLCFGQFLYSDLNYIGAGVLPPNVHDLHLVDLSGPFVLQVDEVVNISCPLRERYKSAPAGVKRCLKLSITDGVQHVFGMEYRPIKSLEALAPAGFKVVIRNVNVRRGLLMLVPEVIEILGGSVEELEAARQRLVHEVNKPPKGKRTRSGIVPPLSTRATLAAWAPNGDSNAAMPPNDNLGNTLNSVAHSATQFQESNSGIDSTNRCRAAPQAGMVINELPTSGRIDRHISRESGQNNRNRETAQLYSSVEAYGLPASRDAAQPLQGRESYVHIRSQETTQSSTRADTHGFSASAEASARECTELNPTSVTFIENEDAQMVDYAEHPFILSGEKESPFIYLASLSVMWAAVQGNEPFVRGKIKCFLTGVKKFQYKGRSTFELRVHVDDGSLISEIYIHHNVVQTAIGCSPEELTAALSSSDELVALSMKKTLKQFQVFLVNFEGIMLMEMNETSALPVAVEMNQGCPASDAWLLLQRLKPDTSRPLCQNGQSDVITLSP